MNEKLGLVSISFRDKTPSQILKAMNDCGLSFIEWGSDVHAPPQKAAEIADVQKMYGVECSSYGTYFRFGTNPLSELCEYIYAAKMLGTDILRLWCGNKNSEDYSQKEKESLFYECREASEIAKKHNVILCMECHNRTYTNSTLASLELMENVNSPYFRMYWQPNQFKSFEENMEYAKAISPYTKNIHVFNWRGEQRYSLHEGIKEWKAFLSAFGKEHTLLLEFMPDDKIETLQYELEALKEIVK